jgi:ribosome maturation protein SDO1
MQDDFYELANEVSSGNAETRVIKDTDDIDTR